MNELNKAAIGMQHHQKIAVYFNLPVYFVVPEEN